MELSETTFRKIVTDYIYHRPKYASTMRWKSQFAPEITIHLEDKPYTQESLGYTLSEDGEKHD